MLILQSIYKNSPECRAAMMYGISNDIKYKILAFSEIDNYDINMNNICNYVPFGSVEFVNKFAKVNNVNIPLYSSYPPDLCKPKWLNREISNGIFRDIPDNFFVKPIKTKLFTGNIKGHLCSDEQYNFANEVVWVSPPVEFINEWRFYILDKKIIGIGQYDAGDDDNNGEQHSDIVMEMIDAWQSQPNAYALDVGIIKDVGLSLVEVNDAWATGMYNGILPNKYVNWVMARWSTITKSQLG